MLNRGDVLSSIPLASLAGLWRHPCQVIPYSIHFAGSISYLGCAYRYIKNKQVKIDEIPKQLTECGKQETQSCRHHRWGGEEQRHTKAAAKTILEMVGGMLFNIKS